MNTEENALSPGPPFTVIVTIQATWELPVITVSKLTHTVFAYSAGISNLLQLAHKSERSFVRGHIVLEDVACPDMV